MLVDTNGDPSSSLRRVLAPEITVKRVVFQGIGQCEDMNRPEEPKVSTEEPKANFPPVPRNQVDHVNATVGQLLVFKVPEVRVLLTLIAFINMLIIYLTILLYIFAGYFLRCRGRIVAKHEDVTFDHRSNTYSASRVAAVRQQKSRILWRSNAHRYRPQRISVGCH